MENGLQDLGPCLIAPSRTNYPTLDVLRGSLYSVDMVRIAVRFRTLEGVIDTIDRWNGLHNVYTYTSNKVGSFRYLWVWDKADAKGTGLKEADGTVGLKIAAGFGLVSSKGKTEPTGFVEFNPNKVCEKGASLVNYLLGSGFKLELSRYDLAIDFPLARDELRLIKDGRKYGCEISNGMTEYLGQRNVPGRVKVYDKQAESKLPAACTRVELTCAGDWDAQTILEKLPTVFSLQSANINSLKGVTRAFAHSVLVHCMHGDVAETWLRMVDHKTSAKIRNAIKTDLKALEYDLPCIERTMEKARKFVDPSGKEIVTAK